MLNFQRKYLHEDLSFWIVAIRRKPAFFCFFLLFISVPSRPLRNIYISTHVSLLESIVLTFWLFLISNCTFDHWTFSAALIFIFSPFLRVLGSTSCLIISSSKDTPSDIFKFEFISVYLRRVGHFGLNRTFCSELTWAKRYGRSCVSHNKNKSWSLR